MSFHTAICKISLKWILLWATFHRRNPSTMETQSKIVVSLEAESYAVLFKVGFSTSLPSSPVQSVLLPALAVTG